MKNFTENHRKKISLGLRNFYSKNEHHTKGVPKSKEQRLKMGESRKRYLERTDSETLSKIYKKMGRTKRLTGVHLGERNSMYGKKRPDLSERNQRQWKDPEFRKKINGILSKVIYKGSIRQRELYNYLSRNFNKKILYNDWKSTGFRYELDISIPSKKIGIEWDGFRFHYEIVGSEKRDLRKNEYLINNGWKFIRIVDHHLNKSEMKEIYEQVRYIIENIDSPKYKYTGGFYI